MLSGARAPPPGLCQNPFLLDRDGRGPRGPAGERRVAAPTSRLTTRHVFIEGARPVLEALRAQRRAVFELWIPSNARSAAQRELVSLANERKLPVHEAGRSREIRARAAPLPEPSFEEILVELGSPRLLVALDGVTDVGNLGSIARSAETAGAQALVLEHRRSPPLSAAALRASAGALEHLPLARAPNLGRALDLARNEGCAVLAADPTGDPLDHVSPEILRGDVVWLLGSEDLGIRRGLLERATSRVAIPVWGRIPSLGVAASAAIVLHRSATARARVVEGAAGEHASR